MDVALSLMQKVDAPHSQSFARVWEGRGVKPSGSTACPECSKAVEVTSEIGAAPSNITLNRCRRSHCRRCSRQSEGKASRSQELTRLLICTSPNSVYMIEIATGQPKHTPATMRRSTTSEPAGRQ